MTATELLQVIRRAGFTLKCEGDAILVKPAGRLPRELREAVKTHQHELLSLLRQPPVSVPAMTPEDQLAEAAAAGLSVSAEAGRLVVRGPKQATVLAVELLRHKEATLPLLTESPPWDQAEADGLLAQARAALARAEAEYRAGRMAEARRNAVRTWLEVCEGYVCDREVEARRGWDVMPLLRAAARHAAETAGCGT